MTDHIDVEVARFVDADRRQQEATAVVEGTGREKMAAVLALRDAGLTFNEIGGLVGLSLAGVQRIAYKAKVGSGW